MASLEQPLRELLNSLDNIADKYPELTDSMVREQLHIALFQKFIFDNEDHEIGEKFGMFSADGNKAIREALDRFFASCRGINFDAPNERLAAFQDLAVKSDRGSTYDDYFGYIEL